MGTRAVRSSSPCLSTSPEERSQPRPRGPRKAIVGQKPKPLHSSASPAPFREPASQTSRKRAPRQAPGPRTSPTAARSLSREVRGPARSGPSSSTARASAPLSSGGGQGGPTIPFWLRGRAGRGGAGRTERAEIIFCFALSAPVPLRRDVQGGRRCWRREWDAPPALARFAGGCRERKGRD